MATADLKFPFARELREQHDALRTALRWFCAEAEQGRPRGGAAGNAAFEILRVIRDQLIQHFRFEELNGFEGGLGSHEPEIQRRVQELVSQHRAFEARLDGCLDRLGRSGTEPAIPAPLLTDLAAFLVDLRRHDAEENALLLRISRGPIDGP